MTPVDDLNYVPTRSGPDGTPALGLMLFLLTLFIWLLSASTYPHP